MRLDHFRDNIVRPVLINLAGAYKPAINNQAIENLLICTAVHESDGFNALVQYGGGPAQGFMQIEPATHDDIWENFLDNRAGLSDSVKAWMLPTLGGVDQLDGNMFYCVAMARLKYWRSRHPLPDAWDTGGLALYYKRVFNSAEGKANVAEVTKTFGEVLSKLRK